MNVLLQLIDHWWEADKDPHPAKNTIASRVQKTPRQIQRILTQLEKAGLIKRIKRFTGHKQQTNNGYNLDGLRKKLIDMEPEFTKEVEQKKLRKKKIETPKRGGA